MTAFAPAWLYLREPADAAARATELVDTLRENLPEGDLVIRDLGCGTGSLGRWLAARLPGTQRWILHDEDAELLTRARTSLPAAALDGSPVAVVAEQRDVTALRAADLAGTSLVTASALLDLLTEDEVAALATAIVEAGCAALLMLSVTGRVELSPADPLDSALSASFNAHQQPAHRRQAAPRPHRGRRRRDRVRQARCHGRPRRERLAARTRSGRAAAAVARGLGRRRRRAAARVAPGRRRLPAAPASRWRRPAELHAVIHHGDLLVLPPSLEVAA